MTAFGLRMEMEKIMRKRKGGDFGTEKEKKKVSFWIDFKIFLITSNELHGLAPDYISTSIRVIKSQPFINLDTVWGHFPGQGLTI